MRARDYLRALAGAILALAMIYAMVWLLWLTAPEYATGLVP